MEKHYGIHIEYTFPDAQETMDLVRTKGMFSFYEDGHQECCRVRKVHTLQMCLCLLVLLYWVACLRFILVNDLTRSMHGCAGEAASAPTKGLTSLDHRATEGSEPWHTGISPSHPGGSLDFHCATVLQVLNTRAYHMCSLVSGQVDPVFEGISGGTSSLVKYNPLSNVPSAEVWNFLRVMVRSCPITLKTSARNGGQLRCCLLISPPTCLQGVPTNNLHACGYISIGCEPCTRPVLPNQHEREGRWWWEVRDICSCLTWQ